MVYVHFLTQCKTKNRFLCLNFTVCVVFIMYIYLNSSQTGMYRRKKSCFRTFLPQNLTRNRHPVILLWTTFFGGMKWFTESKDVFKKYSRHCVLTNNKSDIRMADAVVFHLNDIRWYGSLITQNGVPFPVYRKPSQVWVLYNLEPLPSIWFDSFGWNGIFNWTMTYRLSSDVPVPYGEFTKLFRQKKQFVNADESRTPLQYYSQHRHNGGVTMISNCIDDARRYKIIEILKNYINIEVLGRCGDDKNMDYESRNKVLNDYKFYLAFENSDCKNYVSEKYWRSLERHQIPIVAWKNNMTRVVIPGSYINVFDFRNLDEAGRYIAEVDRNETLYNGYFDWMYSYSIAYQNGWCKLCDALQQNVQHMFYDDIHGWLHDDVPTCKPLTVSLRVYTSY